MNSLHNFLIGENCVESSDEVSGFLPKDALSSSKMASKKSFSFLSSSEGRRYIRSLFAEEGPHYEAFLLKIDSSYRDGCIFQECDFQWLFFFVSLLFLTSSLFFTTTTSL